jgi:transposase-like protein
MDPTTAKPRRDGWTPERRRQFLDLLTDGVDVRRACARIGLSREGLYRLRRRDAAFARAWDEARRSARIAAEEAFIALLPEKLRRTVSDVSGRCELPGARISPLDPVPGVPAV